MSERRSATVMGLGLFGGGAAVARTLAREGWAVTVTDLRGPEELAPSIAALEGLDLDWVLGRHRERDFTGTDLVIANPAVPPTSPFLDLARERGVEVTSEAALFLDRCPARVVAVSGTQGKSSAASFLAALCGTPRCFLGGNIGRSLLDDLHVMERGDLAVVELSSYQLERLPEEMARHGELSPVVGIVLTNVLADHLERHGSREAYARAKARLCELARPGAWAVLPAGFAAEEAAHLERIDHHEAQGARDGLRLDADRLLADDALLAHTSDLGHLPAFQLQNVLVALGAARALGADPAAFPPGLRSLAGLPHRLERLGRVAGRTIWDNGVSTTPDSTVSAMRSLPRGFILVCGGRLKDLPTDELAAVAAERAGRAIVFGAAAPTLGARLRAAGVEILEVDGVEDAARAALEPGDEGGDVLFSPACASFDAWPNFAARARAFREALGPLDSPLAVSGP
ncbi:MAG: UDP-N-acetylmuramoyl-L-alanine--D-glutamate ligase [Planctomycetota bacterium]|nr:UDP-N-acetylmuramoyl-L-alanine--D-glutamate ligase [Planctomycetota bacterium]MDP6761626.1 UDP-N-acetylmuramoyl-L-alanine--D-glutamate ligase [Planctomycetota bacterium]MDP6989526.1 UDP-N-acetylmuramoyl-L-alanine--D-glutamate ligase [Planctomycetota bacterium]